MEDHGARTHSALTDLERTLEDVPDLREVVAVARVVGAWLVAHEARVRLAQAFGPRVKHHLALLTRKAQRLPGHLVGVAILGTVVLCPLAHFVFPSSTGFLSSHLRLTLAAPASRPQDRVEWL